MDEIPEKYRRDLEIIRETVRQLKKDLGGEGNDFFLSGNEINAFQELKDQLIPVIENLSKGDKSVFNSLLYKIDIPEKDYMEALKRESDFPEVLAEFIIRREFQKVLTKRFFSKKND
jgi:hypothetical protein